MRTARLKRRTEETAIGVELNLDGAGTNDISTTIKFFDHMLATFARHGFFDLVVKAEGDLSHHVMEDTGIVLGEAFKKALGKAESEDREKTVRFGSAIVPMDESIAQCAVDTGSIGGVGRSYVVFEADFDTERVEDMSTENVAHFINSFATHASFTIHVSAKGENEHHKIEAIFKALAIALNQATRIEERRR
ncbi:MAG: imidazoleglycerol-phosphate dehydratase [Methanomicrobia archaeon]|nr:imidazoleglycerol-phosphate dehydratase [Methanomicrobia archaeon]